MVLDVIEAPFIRSRSNAFLQAPVKLISGGIASG